MTTKERTTEVTDEDMFSVYQSQRMQTSECELLRVSEKNLGLRKKGQCWKECKKAKRRRAVDADVHA